MGAMLRSSECYSRIAMWRRFGAMHQGNESDVKSKFGSGLLVTW